MGMGGMHHPMMGMHQGMQQPPQQVSSLQSTLNPLS